MPWEITVAGTVHLDDITTPHGRRSRQLGGSALYFALAAAPHARVHLNSIVGEDAQAELRRTLHGLPVDLGGLTVSHHPTFRWHAVQDFRRWVAETVAEEPGCESEWRPRLSPEAARAEVLFLGSMSPGLQREILAQSSARLIGLDSMTCFTGPERDAVRELVSGCDIVFLNRAELSSLVPEAPDWQAAAASLRGRGRLRAVVVKGGPQGAVLVTSSSTLVRPPASVDAVIDPTGAGDAVAGGFLGLCAAAERGDDGFFPVALEEGLGRAAAAIGTFGTEGLRRLAVETA
ncbi:MAG: PfkB family carbohydrate kinase [Candidatus Dormibacteria bacterium]|jgi:sugar/nucleoside kinase (ribokinase family)